MSLNLAAAISSTDTTIRTVQTITDASGPGVITIESEQIAYSGNSENTFIDLIRGYNSTTAVSHAKGTSFTFAANEPSGVGDLNGTLPITVSGGTGALVGAGATVSIPASTDSVNGYLTSTDHAKITNAVPNTRTVNGHPLSSNVVVTNSDLGAVPTTTTVNGKPLSSNVTLAASDVGALDLTGGTLTGTLTQDKAPVYLTLDRSSLDSPISLDARLVASSVDVSVDGAITINGPTNGTELQKITFLLRQDGTGHAVTFASGAGNFAFSTDIPSFTASGANKMDLVGVIWSPDKNQWLVASVIQGF